MIGSPFDGENTLLVDNIKVDASTCASYDNGK